MKKFVIFGFVVTASLAGVSNYLTHHDVLLDRVILNVPYTSQVPDGYWVLPWSEACEETSATMVEAYYSGYDVLPKHTVKETVLRIIDWERPRFPIVTDTEAERIQEFVSNTLSFRTTIVRNPSVRDIRTEIAAGRPVIAMVHQFDLYRTFDWGDSFHVLVIIGYDHTKGVFRVHDPGKEAHTEYPYAQLMNALHDYNPVSKEADGEPTVLFTRPPQPRYYRF